jgi:glucose/arabinose dehydrogenase
MRSAPARAVRRSRLGSIWSAVAAVAAGTLAAAPLARAVGPIDPAIPKGTVRAFFNPIATGLTAPGEMASAPDGSGRLFVVEQNGRVRVLQNGTLQPGNFLDASSNLVTLRTGYDERGLLGLAFHPDFANPAAAGYRKVYTYSSEPVNGAADFTVPNSSPFDNQSVLAEWTVSAADPNVVDPASRRVLMRIDHPQFNHDGGKIAFGPDRMLYIATGDGGQANDVGPGHNASIGNAADTSTVLGKILRVDVNGSNSANGKYGIPAGNPFVAGGGQKEIFAYGLRNPYRFSFAPNGDLLAGDVGQNNIEEVDKIVAGGNYGWNQKEGTFTFNPANGTVGASSPGAPAGLIDPLVQYDHDEGIAILGGFVYHGSLLPGLVGKYVFGDFSKSFSSPTGRLFYADLATGEIQEFLYGAADLPLGLYLKGLGEGPDGELYLMGSTVLGPTGTTGVVLAIVPEPASAALLALPLLLLRRRRAVG